jgi:hypothetical protein
VCSSDLPGNLRKEFEKVIGYIFVKGTGESIFRVRVIKMQISVDRSSELKIEEASDGCCNNWPVQQVRFVAEKADPPWRP